MRITRRPSTTDATKLQAPYWRTKKRRRRDEVKRLNKLEVENEHEHAQTLEQWQHQGEYRENESRY